MAFLVPLALVTYLGFAGGGFEPVVRDRVGLIVWLPILVGTTAAMGRPIRLPKAARAAILVLAAFAVWTGLSMIWSESAGLSADELARASTYLGILVLSMAVSRLGRIELTLAGVATGVAVIVCAALLSRLQPQLFPADATADAIAAARARLNYPLNYWNGLAILIAIGAPLLIHFATHAYSAVARALSTAVLPVLGLSLYLTLSRGGSIAVAAGVVALLALHPRRLSLLPQLAIGAAASAVLIVAAQARPDFTGGLGVNADGDAMTLLTAIACVLAGVGRLGVAAVAARHTPLPPRPRMLARTKMLLAGGAIVAVVAAGLAVDVPGRASDSWERFKDPEVSQDSGRLASASGNGRYQYWDAAVGAYDSAPILGIGAGAFRFWWTREGSIPGEVVDAHSLYLEVLGELGIVGFALIAGFVGGILVWMLVSARRASQRHGLELSTALAAAFAFAVGAGLDWAWEIPVLPACFLILAGAMLAQPSSSEERPAPARRRARAALAGGCLLAALVIVPPFLGASALRDGQARAAAGDLTGALNDAEWGRRVEPYSGGAALQEALVLEQIGRIDDAAVEARDATRKESTNWQAWLALSRMENELSNFGQSGRDYRLARSLDPTSPLFREIAGDRRRAAVHRAP